MFVSDICFLSFIAYNWCIATNGTSKQNQSAPVHPFNYCTLRRWNWVANANECSTETPFLLLLALFCNYTVLESAFGSRAVESAIQIPQQLLGQLCVG